MLFSSAITNHYEAVYQMTADGCHEKVAQVLLTFPLRNQVITAEGIYRLLFYYTNGK